MELCAASISKLDAEPGSLAFLPDSLLQKVLYADLLPLCLERLASIAGPGPRRMTLKSLSSAVGVDHRWARYLRLCSIEEIDLSLCGSLDIDDAFMSKLLHFDEEERPPQICSTLDTLSFRECRGLTDHGLMYAALLPKLLDLQIPHAQVTSSGLCEAILGLPRLQSLSIAYCYNVGHLDFLQLLPELRVLNLSRSGGYSPESLMCLEYLPGLKSLRMSQCHKLKDGALRHILKLKSLTLLDLSGCERLTDSGDQPLPAPVPTSSDDLTLDSCV